MAFYDNKPSKLEALGNGSYLYRWNIQEVTPESVEQTSEEGVKAQAEKAPQFSCEEILVWGPLTSNRITEAVITSKWDAHYEQKLINDYNAVQLGILKDKDGAIAQRYKDFLQQRNELKQIVTADCQEAGIL